MGRTQKRAQICAQDLSAIEVGIEALRRYLAVDVPDDFEFGCIVTGKDFVATWVWVGECRAGVGMYQQEIRSGSVEELFREWGEIEWKLERRKARSFLVHPAPWFSQPELS